MTNTDNKLFAFLLVCGAGLSTCIGAALVYHRRYIKLASKKALAGSLGVSAGVMLYVSFIEIFSKSQGAFIEHGLAKREAYLYATLSFFGGFGIMLIIHKLVHLLDPENVVCSELDVDLLQIYGDTCPEEEEEEEGGITISGSKDNKEPKDINKAFNGDIEMNGLSIQQKHHHHHHHHHHHQTEEFKTGIEISEHEKEKLKQMGLVTALAIGIHNFPEGLATFVATLHDPRVGGALAIAIAIHNIPEGICVAMPIFFATNDRHKAFFWASFSGLSEVIAAALGWLVLSNVTSQLVYGVLFGMVAGMMVNISAYQLIPTAHRYDPKDSVVSHSMLAGMIIMAISLVSFMY